MTAPALSFWSDAEFSDWLDAIQPDGGLVVMFTGYFDESGTHQGSKFLAVGGYVGESHTWKQFGKRWRRHLAVAQVPYFHATDLESGLGIYRGWERPQRIALQERLIATIVASDICGIACGTTTEDFDELVPPGKPIRKLYPNLFVFTALHAVFRALEWAEGRQGRERPVSLVFANGGPTPGVLLDKLIEWRRTDPRVGSITFADSGSIAPLQAADLHVYEAWKHGENRFIDGIKREERKSMYALRYGAIEGYLVNREHLAAFVDGLDAILDEPSQPRPSALE